MVAKARAQAREERVSCQVPELVIHALEVVEVGHHDRERAVPLAGFGDGEGEVLHQRAMVPEPGERVGAGRAGFPLEAARVLDGPRKVVAEEAEQVLDDRVWLSSREAVVGVQHAHGAIAPDERGGEAGLEVEQTIEVVIALDTTHQPALLEGAGQQRVASQVDLMQPHPRIEHRVRASGGELRSRGRASERLTQLEGQVERDLEDARRLLEELEDRIALAHVAALGPTAGDTVARQHVEALLARADALVHETARDLGTDAPVTAP